MRIVILLLALAGSLFLPTSLYADVQKKDWLGTWEMNHDDHIGALSITDSPVSCVTTPWCDLLLHYTGNGQKFTGRILTIDDHWQHITFVISFPGNAQKFDGYIFSGNKNTIAGTTYWGGRTFGFYATRRKAGGPGAGTPNERVNGPGTLRELREVASRIKQERLLAGRVNKPQFFYQEIRLFIMRVIRFL